MEPWPEPVERVAAVLRRRAVDARLEEFIEGTTTAEDAARAVGCGKSQIVKTLVFVVDGRTVLALLPGDRRADASKLATAVGGTHARVAGRDEVLAATGFEPGGVAPFPAPHVSAVVLDRELLRHDTVWIGAGTPRHVAGLSPVDLTRVAGAEIADLSEG